MESLSYELTLAGLAVGSAAALTGIGLIVTYRATGVLNFAHGALAMVTAYTMRQFAVDWSWPLPLAAAVSLLVVAPAMGLTLDRLVFRPLADGADDQARPLVASLGVFVLLVGAASLLWGPGARADAPALLPSGPWAQLGTAVALAAAVGATTRWTPFGRRLRAVVDDRSLAALAGIDADRVAAAGWAFGSFTAGLTGVLMAPYLRLDPYGLPLLVMEVMAVAVLARMRSLPTAVLAALAIGVAQSQLTRLHPSGWAEPLLQAVGANLFVVALLVAALALPDWSGRGRAAGRARPWYRLGFAGRRVGRARRRPDRTGAAVSVPARANATGTRAGRVRAAAWVRGAARRGRRPRADRDPRAWTVCGALFLLPLGFAGTDLQTSVQVPAMGVILLSLTVVTGRGGQLSLGQAAYAGLGALFTALLAAGRLPPLPPMPELPALALAVALVAPLGLLTGVPAIRRHGLALALATLAVGVAVSRFVFAQPYATAALTLARPAGFGHDRAYYVLELAVLAAALTGVAALRRGRYGRALAAMRDHEAGAAAAGVAVPALKQAAFTAGAALAALGGGLLAMGVRAFDPAAFDPVRGLLWFAASVVLGTDSLLGALGAAALLAGLDAGTRGGVAAAVIGVLAILLGRFPHGPAEALRSAARRAAHTVRPGPGGLVAPGSHTGARQAPATDAPTGPRAAPQRGPGTPVPAGLRTGARQTSDALAPPEAATAAPRGRGMLGTLRPWRARRTPSTPTPPRPHTGARHTSDKLTPPEPATAAPRGRGMLGTLRPWRVRRAPGTPTPPRPHTGTRQTSDALTPPGARNATQQGPGLLGVLRALGARAVQRGLGTPVPAGSRTRPQRTQGTPAPPGPRATPRRGPGVLTPLGLRTRERLAPLVAARAPAHGGGLGGTETPARLPRRSAATLRPKAPRGAAPNAPAPPAEAPRPLRAAEPGPSTRPAQSPRPAPAAAAGPSDGPVPLAARPPAPRAGSVARPQGRLTARSVRVSFDGFTALDGVDVAVAPGRVTALVGPNGAGKSTLFHCLCGTLRPDSGRVLLDGRDITRRPAHARTRLGIARTFQQPAVFPSLTVAENVRIGAEQGRFRAPAATERALRLTGLDSAVRDAPAGELPTGSLRRVELGRALAGSPRVLLLDEPAAGLDTAEVDALARLLRALAADGMALLVVEHDLDLVGELAGTAYVMAAGRIVAAGPARRVLGGATP
ncbi:ATP-binding cassette domain-containing protein [Streptomyces sp. NPDC050617]|uniref:ABC transporter permease subunit n=1 Tax=Streptomyces sp. NPDC050617 TaxID=3154628 RepID=UPI00341511E6